MPLAVTHYTNFLTSWAALVGIPSTRITTELAATANTFFNTAMKRIWEAGPWLENSPRAEARFAGNKLTYPNNLAVTSAWTPTALTITANAIENPVDGRSTASKALETVANSAHSILHTATNQTVATNYQVSAYVRPNGRDWVYLKYADGSLNHTCFYDVTNGVLGTQTNCLGNIQAQSNGYYLCTFTFTTSTSVTPTGAVTLQVSTDGSTLSYAGDITKGLYIWGALVQQTSNTGQQDYLIAWDQLGEDAIECVFDVYQTSPLQVNTPQRQGYELTPSGIQLIAGNWSAYYVNGVNQSNIYGSNPANPVFMFYRKLLPNFYGDTFSTSATYAVDDQVYFVTTAGNGDYYKCLVATTAGQSPTTTPASWSVLPIYSTFFQFCVYQAFGDWLMSDGQMGKADGMYQVAQVKMDNEFDRLERQMGDVMPTKWQTYVSAQSRA